MEEESTGGGGGLGAWWCKGSASSDPGCSSWAKCTACFWQDLCPWEAGFQSHFKAQIELYFTAPGETHIFTRAGHPGAAVPAGVFQRQDLSCWVAQYLLSMLDGRKSQLQVPAKRSTDTQVDALHGDSPSLAEHAPFPVKLEFSPDMGPSSGDGLQS